MANGTICTVGQLLRFLKPIPFNHTVKVSDNEIRIINENNSPVAVLNSFYVRLYNGKKIDQYYESEEDG